MLVVLHHEISKDLDALVLSGPSWLLDSWHRLDVALLNFRMPVFFAISGLLAAPALYRPWAAVLGPRVANPYFLFVLWSALQGAFFLVGPPLQTDPVTSAGEFAANLVVPSTTVWYLFALPAYFVVARLLRARPVLALVGGGALFAVARAGLVPSISEHAALVLTYPLFFLLGAYGRERLVGIADAASRRRVAVLGVSFVAASLVIDALELQTAFGAPLVAALLAVVLGVAGAEQLVRTAPRATALLAGLGRRTLPIYVLHLPVLALLHAVGLRLDGAGEPAASAMLVLWPVVATAGAVGASLLLHRALLAAHGRLLFTLPDAALRPWQAPKRLRRATRLDAVDGPLAQAADEKPCSHGHRSDQN